MMTEDIFHAVATAHNDALRRGVLNIWTVYDHPKDFPNHYVARRYEAGGRSGAPTITNDVVQAELPILRWCFEQCGLTCLTRSEIDDPKIIECWL